MYAGRPANCTPIITLLVQTSKKALSYKKELEIAKAQDYDISRFEESVEAFRNAFTKNVVNAKKKYDEAIDGIDKAIKNMEAIKAALKISAGHLDAANNKVEKLSIKQLTKGNKTMSDAFKAEEKKREKENAPDEQ